MHIYWDFVSEFYVGKRLRDALHEWSSKYLFPFRWDTLDRLRRDWWCSSHMRATSKAGRRPPTYLHRQHFLTQNIWQKSTGPWSNLWYRGHQRSLVLSLYSPLPHLKSRPKICESYNTDHVATVPIPSPYPIHGIQASRSNGGVALATKISSY